ncbi:MAG: class I SAM-dependent methyltransferase [Candidatus Niyogibacteria bacterium]|nr:class I SAM-dependent methyltransferase [Candidatus Niyogibacteria bacterium]
MRNCIVCKSNNKIELFDSSVTVPSPYPLKGKQKIVQCERCGFIFSDSENTQEDYQAYYETLNKHKKRAIDAQPLDRQYFEKIFNFLGPLDRNVSILDFGSGDLLMKNMLVEKGFTSVVTYDVDVDLEPGKKFDVIISTHTFEHIVDGDAVLAKLLSHLKDDGVLLLATPDVEGYLEQYCGPYNWFDLEHINHFSKTSIQNFVKNKHLSVIRCVRDKREVRPGLFYPEVILYCLKNNSGGIYEQYIYDTSYKALRAYIVKSEGDFHRVLDYIKKNLQKRVIIRGLGIMAMRIIHHFDFGIADVDVVDSNVRLVGRTLKGKKILSPEGCNVGVMDDAVIIVAAVNFKDIVRAIPEQLSDKVKVIVW